MKLFILAAGRGTRLYPLTKNTPKPLIDLGDGSTILERQLESINKIPEISEVILIVGYRGEQIEAKVKMHKENGMKIKTIYNPFYDVSNNLLSLWLARHEMDTDFMITNGDNIFDPQAFRTLLNEEKEGIFLTMIKKPTFEEDDMKIILNQEHAIKVSKQIPLHEAHAVSVGLVKVKGEPQRRKFIRTMEELARNPNYRDKFWLEIFNTLVEEHAHNIHTIEIDRNHWKEIDFHPDVKNLRNLMGIDRTNLES